VLPSDLSEMWAGDGADGAGDGEVAGGTRARATPSTQIGAPAADFDELMRSLAPRVAASKTPNASNDAHRHRRGGGAEASSSKATGSDRRGREERSRSGDCSTSKTHKASKHGARRERRDAPETDRAGSGAAQEGVEVRERLIPRMDSRGCFWFADEGIHQASDDLRGVQSNVLRERGCTHTVGRRRGGRRTYASGVGLSTRTQKPGHPAPPTADT
jgi:hypothetical protein